MTDTERICWLEAMAEAGHSPSIVFDDGEKWAVSFCGCCPAAPEPFEGFPEAVEISAYVEPDEWQPSLREAIDYARSKRR